MSNRKFTILSAVAFCCISVVCVAQPGGGGDPGANAPITGIEILLALGGLFGTRKIMKSFHKRPKQE